MKNFSLTLKHGVYGCLAATAFAAAPAMASTVVIGSCDSVTDGDADGCLFSGNINESPDPTNVNGYKNAEAAYNALAFADIKLNWITASDAPDFASFGSITGAGSTSGTFSLPGWNLEYFAVKAGTQFELFEYTGSKNWQTPAKQGLSHIAFFGTPGAVPEPATWMFMLLGMASIGFTMRRKEKQTLRVRYS